MNRYWKKWKKLHNVQFEFDDDCIKGRLDVEQGRGWHASIAGPTRVGAGPSVVSVVVGTPLCVYALLWYRSQVKRLSSRQFTSVML